MIKDLNVCEPPAFADPAIVNAGSAVRGQVQKIVYSTS